MIIKYYKKEIVIKTKNNNKNNLYIYKWISMKETCIRIGGR